MHHYVHLLPCTNTPQGGVWFGRFRADPAAPRGTFEALRLGELRMHQFELEGHILGLYLQFSFTQFGAKGHMSLVLGTKDSVLPLGMGSPCSFAGCGFVTRLR